MPAGYVLEGLIKEGKFPKDGVLVTPTFSPKTHAAVAYVNTLKDGAGHFYSLRLQDAVDWSS